MPDDVKTPDAAAAPERGPDGKFLPAGAAAPKPARTEGPEAPEPSRPKAKDAAEFARRRHMLSEKARQLAERERSFQERAAQSDRRAQEQDAQLKALSAKLEQWEKGNPLHVAQAAGKDIDAAIREYVTGATPESVAKKQQDEIAALRKQLEEDKAATQRERQEQARNAWLQSNEQTKRAFVAHVASNAKDYPYLNHEFDEDQLYAIVSYADEELRAAGANGGKGRSGPEVLADLERQAKLRYDRLEAKRSQLPFRRQVEPPPAAPPVSGASGNGRLASRPEPARPPLAAVKTKPNGRLTRDQEEEADRAMLRKAFEKDRIAKANEGKAS